MIFRSDRNKQRSSVEKGHVKKESGVTTKRRKKMEVGTLLLVNNKNSVIVNYRETG